MGLADQIKEQRISAGFSQEQLAGRLHVSRQAVAKWEAGRGVPDIANLIALSEEFGLSLDELIKGDGAVRRKVVSDASAKKWHALVVAYLVAVVVYIAYFAVFHRILMIGFLVATLFMLGFELAIVVRGRRGTRG